MVNETDDWDLGIGGIIDAHPAPPELFPALTLITNVLLLRQIALFTDDDKKRARMQLAIDQISDAAAAAFKTMGHEQTGLDPKATLSGLQRQVRGRLPESLCLGMFISALISEPFTPYEIKIPKDALQRALRSLAKDLGCPSLWIDEVEKAVAEAKRVQGGNLKGNPWGLLIAAVGVGLGILALPLATVFAPAGLAGGAAILAGLAALGPGGVMGGLAILAAVGAAGGASLTAGAFVAGTPQEVEVRVVLIHATVLAKRALRPGARIGNIRTLERMLEELESQIAVHEQIDDSGAGALKQLRKKRDVVKRALTHIQKAESK